MKNISYICIVKNKNMIKTSDEFNEKYKDYIEEGFDGLEIENEKVVIFLDKMFENFIKIPDFSFSQIKVKFGTSRFYTSLSTEITLAIEQQINELIKR